MKVIFLSACCFLTWVYSAAQQFIPGNTYFSSNNYIEYQTGNMPLVVAVPHGGYFTPAAIPDRNCPGCVYVNDAYTQELGRELAEALNRLTGCYPHLIINRLSRVKLDANRDLPEAADGNFLAVEAWYAFHEFIDSAKHRVIKEFPGGLFIDLHGHAHSIQRIELGYLLYSSELRQPDEVLNTPEYIGYSSIRDLATNNLGNLTHAQLLRGPTSLGSLLENRLFPAVPSSLDPFPLAGEPYYSGGYNTSRHSHFSAGHMDAIQMECNQTIRFSQSQRRKFADSLAIILIDFIDMHYVEGFGQYTCLPSGILPDFKTGRIFPVPACRYITITGFPEKSIVRLTDIAGRNLISKFFEQETTLDLHHLPPGIYVLTVAKDNDVIHRQKVLIQCN